MILKVNYDLKSKIKINKIFLTIILILFYI